MVTIEVLRDLLRQANMFDNLKPDAEPLEKQPFDSMSLIVFITSLEEQFPVSIDYRTVELSHFESLDSIRRFLEQALQEVESG